ncbi:flagellar protein FliS [Malonomonas rubra DSM 5091]|uniref:Flagellar secretion chaperone FliS n=1 Tax=Malonomonas rubra DSM 5091 TaxID=1122189 RepID=A0A1M6LB70_MALRU|nr:flagellar export chaperone FliS [Malonomonas rubra]SHJ68399.1 flagellar protein FliS [Malonomonas rubra DSM 5091]
MNAYLNHYQNNQILTASPEQILIMLYDGAIRFVKGAKLAIEEERPADKAKYLSKTIAIITEFMNTLDHEVGGEIAADLLRLYDFMVSELSAVNVRSDAKRLDPVEKILTELREGFAEAIEINRKAPQPGSTMAPGIEQAKQIAASL